MLATLHMYTVCIYIYIEQRLTVPRKAIEVHCVPVWKMSFFIVFYSVLCSSYNVTISEISSTSGQHIWDMLSAVSMFFFFKFNNLYHFCFSYRICAYFFFEFQVSFDRHKHVIIHQRTMGEMHMSLSSLHIHKVVLKAFVGAQHLQRNNIFNVTTSWT